MVVPSFVEVETGFEPDSMVATAVAANSGSRVGVVVIAVAKAAGIAAAAPIAVEIAEDNLAVLQPPVLASSSMAALEADPMLAPAGLAAASTNSVEKVVGLRLPAMLPAPHVLCDRCGYA